ncbi:MAG: SDR family oxidoreductase [Chloroflexota bacterium]
MKSIVITGSSSGLGKAAAIYFSDRGWRVAATMRTPEKETELTQVENVSIYQLDVSDTASINKAAQQIIRDFGTVDTLVNNAGYGSYGILEATPEEKMRRQFDVNVIGVLLVTKAFLPNMRENGSGVIVNISSVGGKITFPLGTLYHGSKFALEGMSEALSYELDTVGIKVKIVEPGGIKSNFGTTSFDMNVEGSPDEYKPLVDKFVAGVQASAGGGSDPSVIAEVVYNAVTDGTDQLRYTAGTGAQRTIETREKLSDAEYIAMMKRQTGI